jgi:hypothetical protein
MLEQVGSTGKGEGHSSDSWKGECREEAGLALGGALPVGASSLMGQWVEETLALLGLGVLAHFRESLLPCITVVLIVQGT